MSRASLAMGFVLSLVIHGVFLVTATPRETPFHSPPLQIQKAVKLILPPPPLEEDMTMEQTREDPPEPETKNEPPEWQSKEQSAEHELKKESSEPENEPELEKLEQVVNPSETKLADQTGDFSESESPDSLPELRLVWDNPGHLIQVAKALGMRILIVDGSNKPAGELFFEKDLLVKELRGKLTSFSNRVRTISAQFFGPEVLHQSDQSVRCFWVLVPAHVDKLWVSIQREALRSRGLKSSQVSYMEARVVPNGDSYKLVMTKVVTLQERT